VGAQLRGDDEADHREDGGEIEEAGKQSDDAGEHGATVRAPG
jgi:hypothetical protein